MLTINHQDSAVAKLLKASSIDYRVSLVATDYTRGDGWKCDKWHVSFNGEGFDYYTGTGHRIQNDISSDWNMYKFSAETGRQLKTLRACLGLSESRNTPVYFKIEKGPFSRFTKQNFAVKPTQASVLYCLISDMSAEGETFSSWCGDLGMDDDSIKAKNIYEECQRNADKIRAVFNPQLLEKLAELLEDY